MAPAELEHLLVSHPGVLDAGVTAVEDELAGQLPKAYVVLNKEFPVTIEELKEYVTREFLDYPISFSNSLQWSIFLQSK